MGFSTMAVIRIDQENVRHLGDSLAPVASPVQNQSFLNCVLPYTAARNGSVILTTTNPTMV